jgi:hypothetical protein
LCEEEQEQQRGEPLGPTHFKFSKFQPRSALYFFDQLP